MSDKNWNNNNIQFPRLLAEIIASQEIDFDVLAKAMDLTVEEVKSLFKRAETVFNSFTS